MERPASRLFLAAAASALASACGAGMPLYPDQQQLPSGEETAEAARTSTESAGDEVVLYATSADTNPTKASGEESASEETKREEPSDSKADHTPAKTTVYLVERTGEKWNVVGATGDSAPAFELFEQIANSLRPSPESESDESESARESRSPDFDPETIQVQSVEFYSDGRFVVRGTADDEESVAEFQRRIDSLPQTLETDADFVRAQEEAEGFEFHFTGRYRR